MYTFEPNSTTFHTTVVTNDGDDTEIILSVGTPGQHQTAVLRHIRMLLQEMVERGDIDIDPEERPDDHDTIYSGGLTSADYARTAWLASECGINFDKTACYVHHAGQYIRAVIP